MISRFTIRSYFNISISHAMVRPRTIDREYLLNVAEDIAAATGAAGLSFGSLAAAAGVSKASVQSAFGTREALIEAMLNRWLAAEALRYQAQGGGSPDFKDRVRAHVRTTAGETVGSLQRVACLMASLDGTEAQTRAAARWYESRIGDLTVQDEEERRLRLAFLATEGAFFLRHVAGYRMDPRVWEDIFRDLQAL